MRLLEGEAAHPTSLERGEVGAIYRRPVADNDSGALGVRCRDAANRLVGRQRFDRTDAAAAVLPVSRGMEGEVDLSFSRVEAGGDGRVFRRGLGERVERADADERDPVGECEAFGEPEADADPGERPRPDRDRDRVEIAGAATGVGEDGVDERGERGDVPSGAILVASGDADTVTEKTGGRDPSRGVEAEDRRESESPGAQP
jgi:hypothetical protein